MIYYTADIHFNDLRVFNKCSRPFADLEDYKNEIIRRWNAKIQDEDIVYILGDIAEDSYDGVFDILKQLKGIKHMIIGNHDLKMLDQYKSCGIFQSVEFMELIYDSGRKVCLCHYPVMDWMEFSRGGYLVYGHIHNKTGKNDPAYPQIKEFFKDKLGYNAGVDVCGYEPVTLDEMIRLKEINKDEPYIN